MSLPKWIEDQMKAMDEAKYPEENPCDYNTLQALSIAIKALERLHDQTHKPCISELCFAKVSLARITKMGDA